VANPVLSRRIKKTRIPPLKFSAPPSAGFTFIVPSPKQLTTVFISSLLSNAQSSRQGSHTGRWLEAIVISKRNIERTTPGWEVRPPNRRDNGPPGMEPEILDTNLRSGGFRVSRAGPVFRREKLEPCSASRQMCSLRALAGNIQITARPGEGNHGHRYAPESKRQTRRARSLEHGPASPLSGQSVHRKYFTIMSRRVQQGPLIFRALGHVGFFSSFVSGVGLVSSFTAIAGQQACAHNWRNVW